MTQIISALSYISAPYDALFVDLWGCVHNGVHALPDAVSALRTYRQGGGTVVLVTNSPRPRLGVENQLRTDFGVPDDCGWAEGVLHGPMGPGQRVFRTTQAD